MTLSVIHSVKAFFLATRPRTYPLAVAGILVGNALAFDQLSQFSARNWLIFILSLEVALGLQILSNLANDYGDAVKGTDSHRPDRQISQNQFTPTIFIKILISWALFIFCCGVGLVWLSFDNFSEILVFIGLGISAIIAAITYTMGKNPYGYHAKGEIAVFIFFGLVNVLGSLYLQTQHIRNSDPLLAVAIGLLCTCVLMVNNMRDIDNDCLAQKSTLAVKLGKQTTVRLYIALLSIALANIMYYATLKRNPYFFSLLLISYPIVNHITTVKHYQNGKLQSHHFGLQLKNLVLLTLLIGLIITSSLIIHTIIS